MRRFLFSGRGRLDRLGYLAALFAAGVLFFGPAALLTPGLLTPRQGGVLPAALQAAILVAGTGCWIVAGWIYGATSARRLHDAGRSGWLALLALIPGIGLVALTLTLLAVPGGTGPNRYGAKWL